MMRYKKEYLVQVLADGNLDELRHTLFDIARSLDIENVAKKANLNREFL
ncbi:hypothetical protein [Campylobacter mucosalis]|nr:hypothetical protein [Campylobacter mucosalis]